MQSELAAGLGPGRLRYAQCWEDADVLLEALDIRPGEACLSVASAGDNTLAMLGRGPARVIAVDRSPAQLACLELRVAAYRCLGRSELLELVGSSPSLRRESLYDRCRGLLKPDTRGFWDARPRQIAAGIGGAGRFERYLALFATRVLPLAHSRQRIGRLLQGGTPEERRDFYRRRWDTWRWRLLFRIFFSRLLMSRLGREPAFFRYLDGRLGDHLLARTRHALTELDPARNPYLEWILTGRHGRALPYALRPENYGPIRRNLDRLEWRCQSVEEFVEEARPATIDRFNLSDIFEYMSPDRYHRVLEQLIRCGRPGGRLVYWNLLAPRSRPDRLAGRLRPRLELARRLHAEAKAFFYSALVIEEILS